MTNTKPTTEMLEEWARDTDENNHTEVRIKICNWAIHNATDAQCADRLRDVKDALEEIMRGQDADGCVNRYVYCRMIVTRHMFNLIRGEFGIATEDLINNSL